MQGGGKLKIYDDGRCPFCQWAAQTMLRFDTEGRLDFRDYNEPTVAAETPFSFEQLNQKMHVQTPDGQWHAGYFGWIVVLLALPRWRWLGRLLRIPPLRWLGPYVYQFVANHRDQVPRFVLRRLGAPTPCPPAAGGLSENAGRGPAARLGA